MPPRLYLQQPRPRQGAFTTFGLSGLLGWQRLSWLSSAGVRIDQGWVDARHGKARPEIVRNTYATNKRHLDNKFGYFDEFGYDCHMEIIVLIHATFAEKLSK